MSTTPFPTEPTVWSLRPSKGTGPVHLAQEGHWGLSWCGRKAQFRHWVRPGQFTDVTCAGCLSAMEKDQPKAWRS